MVLIYTKDALDLLINLTTVISTISPPPIASTLLAVNPPTSSIVINHVMDDLLGLENAEHTAPKNRIRTHDEFL